MRFSALLDAKNAPIYLPERGAPPLDRAEPRARLLLDFSHFDEFTLHTREL